jgi:hypothetical protein
MTYKNVENKITLETGVKTTVEYKLFCTVWPKGQKF